MTHTPVDAVQGDATLQTCHLVMSRWCELSPRLDDLSDRAFRCIIAIDPLDLTDHVVVAVALVVQLLAERFVVGVNRWSTAARHWIRGHPTKGGRVRCRNHTGDAKNEPNRLQGA